jgi:hypothetical protein
MCSTGSNSFITINGINHNIAHEISVLDNGFLLLEVFRITKFYKFLWIIITFYAVQTDTLLKVSNMHRNLHTITVLLYVQNKINHLTKFQIIRFPFFTQTSPKSAYIQRRSCFPLYYLVERINVYTTANRCLNLHHHNSRTAQAFQAAKTSKKSKANTHSLNVFVFHGY